MKVFSQWRSSVADAWFLLKTQTRDTCESCICKFHYVLSLQFHQRCNISLLFHIHKSCHNSSLFPCWSVLFFRIYCNKENRLLRTKNERPHLFSSYNPRITTQPQINTSKYPIFLKKWKRSKLLLEVNLVREKSALVLDCIGYSHYTHRKWGKCSQQQTYLNHP